MDFFEQAKQLKEEEAESKKVLEVKKNIEILQEMEQAINSYTTKTTTKQIAKNLEDELRRRAIENIKISEWERIKINKHNFEDKDEVIDILLYVVGKMAQDPIFYKMNIAKLKGHTPIYTKEAEW